jgi:hypothetical protein
VTRDKLINAPGRMTGERSLCHDNGRIIAAQRSDAMCQHETLSPFCGNGNACSFIRELPAGHADLP